MGVVEYHFGIEGIYSVLMPTNHQDYHLLQINHQQRQTTLPICLQIDITQDGTTTGIEKPLQTMKPINR